MTATRMRPRSYIRPEGLPMRTLLIDTFNLFHLLGEVNGEGPIVVRNDELPWDELVRLAPDNVVISPGHGRRRQRRLIANERCLSSSERHLSSDRCGHAVIRL